MIIEKPVSIAIPPSLFENGRGKTMQKMSDRDILST